MTIASLCSLIHVLSDLSTKPTCKMLLFNANVALSLLVSTFFTIAVPATPAPTTPTHTESGCGKPHSPGFHGAETTLSIVSDNKTRYYGVQVPPEYNFTQHYPLIFDYHGNGENFTDQRLNSLYFNYTAGREYLVVYPQGYKDHWQGASYAVKNVSDLNFTVDLLAQVKAEYCVNDERVYASGKSNGGGFVDLLACSDAGDAFAAFGMASAALYTDTNLTACSRKRALLESHGDIDSTIPYGGNLNGNGGILPNITDWVSWWGQRDCGVDAEPKYTTRFEGYNITSYSCRGFEDVVKHYQVFELGHCWPSAFGENWDALHQAQKQRCEVDRVLDFTPKVLEFFGEWNMTRAKQLSGSAIARVRLE